jgi:hypothetical protein
VIVVGLAVVIGLFAYSRWGELTGGSKVVAERPVALPEKEAAAPEIRHPILTPPSPPPRAEGEVPKPVPEPLPSLDESDPALQEDLRVLFDERPVAAFLIPKHIVANTVVAIDNLDHKALSLRHWPVKHIQGQPTVEKRAPDDGKEQLFLIADNAGRYDAYVEALQAVDAERLVELYVRYYPLFQEAYENLGYPDRYFNDRLIALIDHLLATPEVPYPIELRQPEVLYEFADPELEALSWGQKTLIRMGPSHMAAVKAKLREIRAEIVARAAVGGA